jgi:magnesium chelatase family protein
MSLARTTTFAFLGVEALPVEVQVQLAPGLPAFALVGLPNKAVAESRERVRGALATLGVMLPPKRVLVNLAPADLAKEGAHFDLPIALALLAAMEVLPREEVAQCAALGELALDARLMPVPGILPAALAAADRDLALVCPAAQGPEAAWAGATQVLAPDDLGALIAHMQGRSLLAPPRPPATRAEAARACLSELRGQESAKRAIEIAAAGAHSVLLIGPPGAGKSMLAARLPSLLPDLTPREALDVSIVHSVAGLLREGRIASRPPFRDPHHSASEAALIGGGPRLKPGEVSLAHRGVLFLDELPEFARPALEALRQPLESGEVVVSRAAGSARFPARVQFVAAMNPCPCGHLGAPSRECGRAPGCAADYRGRVSGPLLDREDMVVEMAPIPARELARAPAGESSASVAARVAAARAISAARGGTNAEASLEALKHAVDSEALSLAEQAAERLGLSNRGFARLLRVARSVADLAGAARIGRAHLAEALAFRGRAPR